MCHYVTEPFCNEPHHLASWQLATRDGLSSARTSVVWVTVRLPWTLRLHPYIHNDRRHNMQGSRIAYSDRKSTSSHLTPEAQQGIIPTGEIPSYLLVPAYEWMVCSGTPAQG